MTRESWAHDNSHSKSGARMTMKFLRRQSTRREMLRNSAELAGGALFAQLFPASLLGAGVPDLQQQAAPAATWGKGFFTGDVFVQMVYSSL